MEELTGKWARLSLNISECQTIPLAPGMENNSKILLVKLFTKRWVSMEALSRTLRSMWQSIKDFEVCDLTSNTILILFSNKANVMKKSSLKDRGRRLTKQGVSWPLHSDPSHD
ncbi:hypothetical protein CFP56_035669 [Quercus suber]|uniref:Uncharacterized protein n=1 Tax=Quercus suber TaxID=58331 RepID=A0AAW0J9L5_QUESU